MKPRDIILSLGILWIVFGVIAIFAGVFGVVQSLFAPFSFQDPPLNFPSLGFFIKYRREASIAQIVLGTVLIISGIGFIQRRSWARWTLQIFAGINIVWGIIFGYFWLNAVHTITTSENVNSVFLFAGFALSIFGIVAILITIGMWALCIRLLNHPSIRAEFHRSAGSS